MYIPKIRLGKGKLIASIVVVAGVLISFFVMAVLCGKVGKSVWLFAIIPIPGYWVFISWLIMRHVNKVPAPKTTGSFAYTVKQRERTQGVQPEILNAVSQERMFGLRKKIASLSYAEEITNIWSGVITDVRRIAPKGTEISQGVVQYECDYCICTETETERGTFLVYDGEPKTSDQLVCLEILTSKPNKPQEKEICQYYFDLEALAYFGYDYLSLKMEFNKYFRFGWS